MKKIFLLGISWFLLFSCSSSLDLKYEKNGEESIMLTRSMTEYSIVESDNYLSQEDAVRIVESYDQRHRFVKRVNFKKPLGESSSYYEIEFSYGDQDGYAIIPSDSRLNKPICFVDYGSLNDTLVIEPLKYYFRNIPQYLINKRKELDSLSSSENRVKTLTRSLPEINPDNSTLIGVYYEHTSDTISRKVLVNWGQCAPLGTNINYNYGYCSVPAVAQVMSYHKKTYCGYTASDWNDMISGSNNDAVADVGLNVFNGIHWFFNTIAPLPHHIVSFLDDNNYSASSSSGYSFSTVQSYLQYGPAIILGFSQDPIFHPDSGHYWVIDAASENKSRPVYVYEYVEGMTIIEFEIKGDPVYNNDVYFNWGWSGSSNGWYDSGVFQPTSSSYNFINSIRLIKIEP